MTVKTYFTYSRLEGMVLYAEVVLNGVKMNRSIDLSDHIGWSNGALDLENADFPNRSAFKWSLEYEFNSDIVPYKDQRKNNMLRYSGTRGGKACSGTLNLDLVIYVRDDGSLGFQKFKRAIHLSTSLQTLNGSTLSALCVTKAGDFREAHIDLDMYYDIVDGEFKGSQLGKDGIKRKGYYAKVKRSWLEVSKTNGVVLHAELKQSSKSIKINLSECVENTGGMMEYVEHTGPLDRDGYWAKFFEKYAYTGLFVAALHEIAGNSDHAGRAVSYWAKDALTLGVIALAGAIGGPFGTRFAKVIMEPVSNKIAELVAKHNIEDPSLIPNFETDLAGVVRKVLMGEFEKISTGRWKQWFEAMENNYINEAGKEFVKQLGGGPADRAAKEPLKALKERVLDPLEKELKSKARK